MSIAGWPASSADLLAAQSPSAYVASADQASMNIGVDPAETPPRTPE
jgi:hypothetical protein